MLEIELEKFDLKAEGPIYSFTLSDLVMLQMVGNIGKFIEVIDRDNITIGNREKAYKFIKDTQNLVTSQSLFSGIVQKTIEAQFGEKHTALNQIGQNSIDSYLPGDIDRNVIFDTFREEGYLILKAKDYGVGMDMKTLVSDLLIPYNSSKEFDITKIGEHGIGWYSLVDLAEFVKVITKTRDSGKPIQAVIYKDNNEWNTKISYMKELQNKKDIQHGTEIIGHIPEDSTSDILIRDFLYQYLGLVNPSKANIFYGKENINSIRELYEGSMGADLNIGNTSRTLKFLVSKNAIKNIKDNRFKHRYSQLNNLMYTQAGLFVKYDSASFKDKTIHAEMLDSLMGNGLDFIVEIPDNVTLTKGRNSIIADHEAPLLDSMYRGFESIILDTLLTDDEMMTESSNIVLQSIADIFDKNYKKWIENMEMKNFSFGRRMLTRSASIGSKTIDIGALAIKYTGKAVAYPFVKLADGVKALYNIKDSDLTFKEKLKNAGEIAVKYTPKLAALTGLSYLEYEIYKYSGWIPVAGSLGGAISTYLGYQLYKNLEETTDIFHSSFTVLKYLNPLVSIPIIYDFSSKKFEALLHKLGLYVDIDEKRKRKLNKRLEKITKKYLSKFAKDKFLNKVVRKNIIPAEFVYSNNDKNITVEYLEKLGIYNYGAEFSEKLMIQDNGRNNPYQPREIIIVDGEKKLNKHQVKLSIDDLVELYLKRKLIFSKKGIKPELSSGEFFVQYSNPIVQSIIDKMDGTSLKISSYYDVKVLEDYIDNITTSIADISKFLYFFTPIGMAHLALSRYVDRIDNPFEETMYFNSSKKFIELNKDFFGNIKGNDFKNVGHKIAKTTLAIGTYTIGLPFLLTYWGSKAALKHIVIPGAKKLNPLKYPGYSVRLLSHMNFDNIACSLNDFFKDSFYNIPGLYNPNFNHFKDLDINGLGEIVNAVGAGKAYLDYFTIVKELDNLISKTLDTPNFNIYMDDMNLIGSEGLYLNKNKDLHIEIHGVIGEIISLSNINESYNNLNKVVFTVLDNLIHLKTHNEVFKIIEYDSVIPKEPQKIFYNHDYPDKETTRQFYEKKKELRRKTMHYFDENNINVLEYVGKFLPSIEETSSDLYFIYKEQLTKLVNSNNRELKKLKDILSVVVNSS